MADTDPAIIGVWPCGCVTFALARPADPLPRDDAKKVAELVSRGASIVRTTVGEAKARPCFLVDSCPHEPRGWG